MNKNINNIAFSFATDGPSAINEDEVNHSGTRGWILDGATSLSGRKKLFDGNLKSDASWFVQEFSSALYKLSDSENFLDESYKILQDIRRQASIVWGEWNDQDVPSSSFSYACVDEKIANLNNLGDCRIQYSVDGGKVEAFGSCSVDRLDRNLLNSYISIRRSSPEIPHKDIWMTLVPEIRKNRSLMNKPDGYWILSPDGSGISHIESISIPYEKNIKILLTSDGLYRLVDTYFIYSESDFFKKAFSQDGLNNLINELRKIESSDEHGVLFPRVKLQDDASGLCINANNNPID